MELFESTLYSRNKEISVAITPEDPCYYNPCGNNAICYATKSDYDYNDYKCECAEGFVGDGYTDCEDSKLLL